MNLGITQPKGVFASTDAPAVDVEKTLPDLAPTGSLLVSAQSGSHRGVPQKLVHSRAIAVRNLLVKKFLFAH